MGVFGDALRERCEKQEEAAKTLFESKRFDQEPKTQALAIVAKVTANLLYVLADTVDYLRASESMDEDAKRREAYMERNNAIRNAATLGAASGDWSNFDRLVREFGAVASAEGSPARGSEE